MSARLSIRSYTFVSHTHAHNYHQLVMPLVGSVDINTGRHEGRASPGQCIITLANHQHRFDPEPGSCFLVADMHQLPESLLSIESSFVRISPPMQAFCYFAQKQLEHKVSPDLEQQIGQWFVSLINEQQFLPEIDPRIVKAINYLESDLQQTPTLPALADIACLSLSQYKKLFKSETGQSTGQYLQTLRMEKSRALLVHTDYPINLIANLVGYQDLSAFSHRFSSYFGFAPSKLRSRK